jgi:2-polyprenyl-3-methyl-5-hydroxy-6-metoxy-1,4-benzoquinol methylase
MKFTANGRHYELQQTGHIEQIDAKPYVYDAKYSSTYDTKAYEQKAEILQALRLGFIIGCHGRIPKTITDMGYGNGAFIKTALKVVPNVYGFDITDVPLPEGAHDARQERTLTLSDRIEINETWPEFARGSDHVVTFNDCFEHIEKTKLALYLRQMKNDDCEICISLPNCDIQAKGLDWFANDYPHLKPDEHLRHFSAASLERFMKDFSYRRIAVSYHEDIVRSRYEKNILTMYFK